MLSRKPKFWYSETHSSPQTNEFSESTLSMQTLKLQYSLQTTYRRVLSVSDF